MTQDIDSAFDTVSLSAANILAVVFNMFRWTWQSGQTNEIHTPYNNEIQTHVINLLHLLQDSEDGSTISSGRITVQKTIDENTDIYHVLLEVGYVEVERPSLQENVEVERPAPQENWTEVGF